jgi:Intein/homing endonuclease
MGFLSGISSFVKEHSGAIHGVLDVAGFIPGVGAVADMANAAIYAAEGDWMNAASSVVSAIPGVGDTMALASKSAKAAKAGLKGMKEMSALSKAKGMKKMLGALRGKAKTGAKKAGQKLKDLWGKFKNLFKRKCTGDKCFTGDTPVFTSRGYRPIREMQKGDDIYSRDEKTGETGIQEVEEVFCTGTHTVYHIWLDGEEEIKTTAYHPVYVKEQGWVSAINLREGDIVETMDGPAQITKIVKVRHEEKVPTYNLHVKEWASYFVGEARVYVHNGKGHKHKAKSKRLEYMGKTPGKKSKTGREVIERMRGEGKIRDTSSGMEFQASDGKWYPIKDADMAHTTDAVAWWNNGGYKHGPRSKQARGFMKDSNNYTLDHYSINRSQGAKLGQTYR